VSACRSAAEIQRDLFQAHNLVALAVLDRPHERCSFVQAFVRAGIEPGIAAPEPLDVQIATFEIGTVDVGNLELAPRRWLHRGGDVQHVVIVEIHAGDRPGRFGLFRLFLNAGGASVAVEHDDTIAFGIFHGISEHGRSARPRRRRAAHFGQSRAMKDIVAEHQRDTIIADKVATDDERFGQAVRRRLFGIGQGDAELRTVAEQGAERRQIARRRNDQDFADASEHEDAERIIDHRLVVDGEQLL
jgi:hypothetical protein